MCEIIIIEKLKINNELIKYLKLSAIRNSDGYGITTTNLYAKTLNFDEFLKILPKAEGKKCLIHFRLATIGKISIRNTQPIQLNPYLFLTHNGHIPNIGSEEESDSKQLAKIIRKLKIKHILKILEMLEIYGKFALYDTQKDIIYTIGEFQQINIPENYILSSSPAYYRKINSKTTTSTGWRPPINQSPAQVSDYPPDFYSWYMY